MSDASIDAARFYADIDTKTIIKQMMEAVTRMPAGVTKVSLFNGMVVRESPYLPDNSWIAVDAEGKILAGSYAGREPFLVTEQGWDQFIASPDVVACLKETIDDNGGDLDAAMAQLNEEVHGAS